MKLLQFGETYNIIIMKLWVLPIAVHGFSWINQILQGQLKMTVFLFSK